jgi:isocitrate lyase
VPVPGVIVARTDAEAATFLEGRGDERDHPFILGATNVELPACKVGYLAILRKLRELGVDDARGHLLFKISAAEYDEASAWLARADVMRVPEESAKAPVQLGRAAASAPVTGRLRNRCRSRSQPRCDDSRAKS